MTENRQGLRLGVDPPPPKSHPCQRPRRLSPWLSGTDLHLFVISRPDERSQRDEDPCLTTRGTIGEAAGRGGTSAGGDPLPTAVPGGFRSSTSPPPRTRRLSCRGCFEEINRKQHPRT